MKPIQILLAVVLSLLACYSEFRPIKEEPLFFDWIINSMPLLLLWLATAISLFIAIKKTINGEKLFRNFNASIICVLGLLVVYWHADKIKRLDNSTTAFTAMTRQIGNDGGFWLDFKTNGHIKGTRQDHWCVTHYWGNYSIVKDTVTIDIPVNFKLGNRAVIINKSLNFIDDTTEFTIYK